MSIESFVSILKLVGWKTTTAAAWQKEDEVKEEFCIIGLFFWDGTFEVGKVVNGFVP